MSAWKTLLAAGLMGLCAVAQADGVDALRAFVRDVKSGRAAFVQTVVSPDGARSKTSSGTFEFERPHRFRFDYLEPYVQQIVSDGQKVWVYDPDLNQVSVRKVAQALGTTPAALLAGTGLDEAFTLTAEAQRDGLNRARATPKTDDSGFQWMTIGFKGQTPATVEILDTFGQRSLLKFSDFQANVPLKPERFRFTPPAGADVLEQ